MPDVERRNGGAAAEAPIGELVKQLSAQTSTLVRQELELARVEMTEKGKRAGIGAGMFGGAGLMAVFALGCVTAAVILALDAAMPAWLAALIVAVVYLAIAGVLALTGRKEVKQATPPAPQQAIESVKEDVEWTKQRAQAARR